VGEGEGHLDQSPIRGLWKSVGPRRQRPSRTYPPLKLDQKSTLGTQVGGRGANQGEFLCCHHYKLMYKRYKSMYIRIFAT
jgi:hypothetical protein